ncbi:MAG: hypothetical protein ACO4CG_05910 [Prochlorothrix sp.]
MNFIENLLLLLFALSSLLAFIFLFINWSIALLMASLAGVFVVFYSSTPEGKRLIKEQEDKKKAEEDKKKAEEESNRKNYHILLKNIEKISSDPTDINTVNSILSTLSGMSGEQLTPLVNTVILPLLMIKPLEDEVRQTVLSCGKSVFKSHSTKGKLSSELFYNAALQILEENPGTISLKQYALDIGRWHYSLDRPDKKVTIYDEQAIQNDILVRSK